MTTLQLALAITGSIAVALGSLWYWGAKMLREFDGLGVDWDFETMAELELPEPRVDHEEH